MMKKLTKSAAVLLGVLVFAGAHAQQGDAQAGSEKTAICAACHGADGNSPVPMYPKLAGLGAKYLYKQMQDIKTDVRPVVEMTGMLEPLSDQDLADIAAFYASQTIELAGAQEQQVRVNSGDMVDSLALGRNIYRFGNPDTGVPSCSGCHSPTGVGNEPAGYPRVGGQFTEYVAKQLRDFRGGERVNDDQQVMRQVAARMSDAEIAAVSNYIAGLYAGERNTAAR